MSDLRTWEAWRDTHQPFELKWWKDHLDNYRDNASFAELWREVKEFIQPIGLIIDIGCGPRPPFAPCIAIDPLADKYREITPPEWWGGVLSHARPAEEMIEPLRGEADTVICWNCIDHTIGWRQILDNMIAYGKDHVRYALATDFWQPFEGHPGFDRSEFMHEIEQRFEITVKREPFGRQLALMMIKKKQPISIGLSYAQTGGE